MLLLVTTAHPQAVRHSGSGFGRLVQPRHYPRIADTAAAGIPWAADNDCYQGLNPHRYRLMLAAITGLVGCRFVVVPDVVADHSATMRLWDAWRAEVGETGQPCAFVLQNGATAATVPWHEVGAVFVGGDTEWKLGLQARRLVHEARERGLWVHMGRVNSRKRFGYARAIQCDSVDGTKFSRWRNTWLPLALTWHRQDEQLQLPVLPVPAIGGAHYG